MSSVMTKSMHDAGDVRLLAHADRPHPATSAGRQRVVENPSNRVRVDGKFFRLGQEKFFVKGVTYGPFEPNSTGVPLPEPDQVRRDFRQMLDLSANTLRIYQIPPTWFLDLAQESGLKVFLDIDWPKNLLFIGNRRVMTEAHDAVRRAARSCGNHPALLALSLVNEVPADLVRLSDHRKVSAFLDELADTARQSAPQCLLTFANFPTTEYLQPREIDFVSFNVYLHQEMPLRNYLARLQNIAGSKPLVLGEYGVDTHVERTEAQQAEILPRQLSAAFDEGVAGAMVFSFTDDWFTQGCRIDDWAFGLVHRDRTPKPAFAAVRDVYRKAPRTADATLPAMSVVICSYNGASTVESCLRSMERLKYPNYEVIFIDDGSTDRTQEILQQFPQVRNIRQKNMGLSHARNVGLAAARGEVVVYTDSDCEADEDWLYYLGLAMARSGYAGMGGPNLIPDEGSWIAECVGSSPGGPTHVMIDDRTAEHVPGCNMAFSARVLREVNGFDPQFRKAGDDVDVIWRIQNLGHTIGFAPAAQVWHYRRNTVSAYLKQQRGYGEAEALLKYKHPEHFNTLGASHWRGRIYGGERIGVRVGGDVIYHGVFGTGLFQTIYTRPASMAAMLMMSVEWHLLGMFTTILGLAWTPLLFVAALMFLTPIVLAAVAAAQAPPPRHPHRLSRALIAYLHYRQPITRGWARYSVRLRAKTLRREATGYRRNRRLPFDPMDRQTLMYWSGQFDRIELLHRIGQEVHAAGWRFRVDSGWNKWDMEIYGSRYAKARLTTATEKYGGGNMTTRVRVHLQMSKFCQVLAVGTSVMAGVLLIDMWPLSRPAVLIPLIWWAMYLVNRWRMTAPVMGLIDAAAENAGFWPIDAIPGKTEAAPDATTVVSSPSPAGVDLDDGPVTARG